MFVSVAKRQTLVLLLAMLPIRQITWAVLDSVDSACTLGYRSLENNRKKGLNRRTATRLSRYRFEMTAALLRASATMQDKGSRKLAWFYRCSASVPRQLHRRASKAAPDCVTSSL
jgi:hypothetical protein